MKRVLHKTTINDFIKKRPHLIWYTKNYDGLNAEAIVEATLNYGNWADVQTLIKIMGVKEVARVFGTYANRPRCNYRSDIKHFFTLYFKRHA